MKKFIFIVDRIEELEDEKVKFIGVTFDEMIENGTEAFVYCIAGDKFRTKVIEAAYDENLDVTVKGLEKAAYVIIEKNVSKKFNKFDVISNLRISEHNKDTESTVVDNTRLQALFWRYKNDADKAVLGAIFQDIAVCAKFYVVADKVSNGKKDGLRFPTLQTKNKKRYYAAFSSQEELAASQKVKGTQAVILDFDDFVALLHKDPMANGLVIDPFSSNLILDRKTMANIRNKKIEFTGGITQMKFEKEEKVDLSSPDKAMGPAIEAVCKYAGTNNNIKKIWARKMERKAGESLLMIVEFNGDLQQSFAGIAASARPHLNGIRLEIIPLEEGFGKRASELSAPIYTK